MASINETFIQREAEFEKRNEALNAVSKDDDLDAVNSFNERVKRIQQAGSVSTSLMLPKEEENQKVELVKEDDNQQEVVKMPRKKSVKRVLMKSKSKGSKIDLAPSPVDSLAADPDMGADATIRYQKARLEVLQEELDRANEEFKEQTKNVKGMASELAALKEEKVILTKKVHAGNASIEKFKTSQQQSALKQKTLEVELAAVQSEYHEFQKSQKVLVQGDRSKDVRLNRALEELEKTKSMLRNKEINNEGSGVPRKDHEKILKENARLEKQKTELLTAFKKQLKLIDILKRQKIHMEAAKMLSFTEEEFSKALELGT